MGAINQTTVRQAYRDEELAEERLRIRLETNFRRRMSCGGGDEPAESRAAQHQVDFETDAEKQDEGQLRPAVAAAHADDGSARDPARSCPPSEGRLTAGLPSVGYADTHGFVLSTS